MTKAKGSKRRTRKPERYRLRQTFWLDANKRDENELLEAIEELKAARQFVSSIRDGLRLINDLRNGRVDVLLELFPFVKTAISTPQKSDNGDEIAQLKKMLQDFIAVNSNGTTYHMGGAPKALPVKKLDLPRFDDDDMDTLVVKKDTSINSAQNFISSLMRLQQ